MEPKKRSGRSIFLRSLVSAAAAAVIIGALVSRTFSGGSHETDSEPLVFPAIAGGNAVILNDDANRDYWGERPGEPQPRIQMWLNAVENIGMSATTVTSIADWQDELLVLPHSFCLSQADVELIHDGLTEGKGVLFVGPVGVRDSDCEWLGWNRFHSIMGTTNLREFSGLETMFLVVTGTGPVGSLSSAGHRISFLQREGQWGVAGLPAAAYWADYDRKAFPVEEEFHAAVVGTRGSGRFSWVGFDPDLAAGSPDDQEAFARLLADLATWSLSVPVSEVDLYPSGSRSGLVFVMDTEWRFENAVFLGDFLQSRGIRGGFMCVNEFANEHPELVLTLAQNHDIGSHSEDHTTFAGQSLRTQVSRLRQTVAGLEELSLQQIMGFRPPEEVYDDVTLAALAETGFSYVLGGEATSAALPVLLDNPNEDTTSTRLVLIPRIQRDDLYLANSEELNATEMSQGLRDDWVTVRRHRGIHYVSVHSTFITGPEQVAILERFLDEVSLDDVWAPGPNELAEWWRNRWSVRTELLESADGELLLTVLNDGAESIEHVGVWAVLPGNPRFVGVVGERVQVDGPDERGAYFFLVDHLSPGDSLGIPIQVDRRMN